jgi:hypothetical protein
MDERMPRRNKNHVRHSIVKASSTQRNPRKEREQYMLQHEGSVATYSIYKGNPPEKKERLKLG